MSIEASQSAPVARGRAADDPFAAVAGGPLSPPGRVRSRGDAESDGECQYERPFPPSQSPVDIDCRCRQLRVCPSIEAASPVPISAFAPLPGRLTRTRPDLTRADNPASSAETAKTVPTGRASNRVDPDDEVTVRSGRRLANGDAGMQAAVCINDGTMWQSSKHSRQTATAH